MVKNINRIISKGILYKMIFPLLMGIIGTIVTIFIPFGLKLVVDGFIQKKSVSVVALFILAMLFLVRLFCQILSAYFFQKIGVSLVYDLRKILIDRFLYLKKRFFKTTNSAEIASILTNDTALVYALISQNIPQIISNLILLIGIGVVLVVFNFKLTLVLLCMIPLFLLLYIPLGKIISNNSKVMQETLADLNGFGYFISKFSNLIKVSLAENFEKDKGYRLNKRLNEVGVSQAKVFSIIAPIVASISLVGVVAVILIGLYDVSRGSMTVGSLVAYLTLVMQFIEPLSGIGAEFSQMNVALGGIERILQIIDLENSEIENSEFGLIDIPFDSLCFDDVGFHYKDSQFQLENLKFKITRGESLVIVGPSGSGKTTLLSLIPRLYDFTEGDILIDGTSIKDIKLSYLRQNIGFLEQDYSLITGTIKDNLLYGLDKSRISDENLEQALKKSSLDLMEKNASIKLDTFVGENGNLLSNGQRQRIALARILLLDPEMLILDEFTSALDAESEFNVLDSINELESKIILIVAHRLTTIRKADKIIFLENGEITGFGDHESLLKTHREYANYINKEFK